MVKLERPFLVDAAFLVERARRSFLGAPLLRHGGRDFTLVFSWLRDFLRIRHEFGMTAGAVVVGATVQALIPPDIIGDLLALLKKLGIVCLHARAMSEHRLASAVSSRFSVIVTADRRFFQLSRQDCTVVLFKATGQPECEWITPERVKLEFGVPPEHVPTYLALTEGPRESILTEQQASRLVALFGDLESIYKNLARVTSSDLRTRLEHCESGIRGRFTAATCNTDRHPRDYRIQPGSLAGIDSVENRRLLVHFGFFSLLPLLPNPAQAEQKLVVATPKGDAFRVVADRDGLEALESAVQTSRLCAVDVEADDKDPRKGTPLGIAFAPKAGGTWFVPLLETVLTDIPRSSVLNTLKRILASEVDFIGHNLKYDCLLLRRIAIPIRRAHFDTMLAAFECHGDWPFFKLQYLAQRLLGKKIKSYRDILDEKDVGAEISFREMVAHACQDADATLRLYPVLSAELAERHITDQYHSQCMALLPKLVEWEFRGVTANLSSIRRLGKSLLAEAQGLRSNVPKEAGRIFDPDSDREVFEVLGDAARARGYFGPRRIPLSMLEGLAISNPVARLVAQYRRLRAQVSRLESIVAAAHRGVIHPLFNQIRSRCGLLSTTDPSLFDLPPHLALESCLDPCMRPFFRHPGQALERLAKLTKDPVLRKVRGSQSRPDPFMAKHPLLQGLNCDEFLLFLALGHSDAKLSRHFLIQRLEAASVRHDLEQRYRVMFQWLNRFCRATLANGFAASDGQKKYIDGLRCSDLARREQALEYAVRWLVRC
jgi:DNA polymerase I-like protein with 3'-5' exonuclease and polymerase domains